MNSKPNSKNRKSICLVDLRLTGHHPFYLANFAHTFQNLDFNVAILTPDPEMCVELLQKALPQLETDGINFLQTQAEAPKKSRIFGCRSYCNLKTLQKEIMKHQLHEKFEFDLVFFAYLDDLTYWDFKLTYLFGHPFSLKFSGLLMTPRDRILKEYPFPLDRMVTNILEQSSSNYSEIGLLVEDVQDLVDTKLKKKTVVYPDFCTHEPLHQNDIPLVKEITSKKQGRTVTSLLGSIRSQKGVDLFLDCIQVANAAEHFFVIAGKFAQYTFTDDQWKRLNSFLADPPENLLISDNWLESEATFDTLVQHSDYLFACYKNFNKSSNILSKGAFYSTPVIVSDEFLMGARVRKYQLGLALSENQILDMYKKPNWGKFVFDEDLRSLFVEAHSVKRLTGIFSNLLHD